MTNLIEMLKSILLPLLEPIAAFFDSLGIPEPITHWGHPTMMAIVIFIMGTFTAWAGWQSRLATDEEVALKNRSLHRKAAPFMSLFLALGYTGGLLSLVMQKQSLLESPHFWTGTTVLILLAINGGISLSKFGGGQPILRTVHAYLGSGIVALLFIHAAFGLKLGLSI